MLKLDRNIIFLINVNQTWDISESIVLINFSIYNFNAAYLLSWEGTNLCINQKEEFGRAEEKIKLIPTPATEWWLCYGGCSSPHKILFYFLLNYFLNYYSFFFIHNILTQYLWKVHTILTGNVITTILLQMPGGQWI